MNLLFVCKFNRFRSKVAEAIFLKLNEDETVEVKSAGLLIDLMRPYVAPNVRKALEKRGYNVVNETSRRIDDYLLGWADRIVIVADNVSADLFPKGKTEVWGIGDCDEGDEEKIGEIVGKIEVKVRSLIASIKKIG